MNYCSRLQGEKRKMNIKPYDKTIRELLVSGRQFLIPRFQREYSWDKKNYKEFLEDMLNGLEVADGKIINEAYFLGTMLFIGDYAEGTDKEIQVVDGQQRLTTITILFSALSDRFCNINEDKLSSQLFRYIMTEDDNGESVRVLKSRTHYPFFSYYIQEREKKHIQEAVSEEEKCIEEAYQYLYGQLEEKKVKNFLNNNFGREQVNSLEYVDILKAIRDQVLQTTFVSISTTDKEQANMIFEILNAKGKRLAQVDLIKNKIFEVLDTTEPADFAEEMWAKIKLILNGGKESVGLETFYRHFWLSKYKKSSTTRLYDDFNKVIKPKNKENYSKFMLEMEKNAKYYMRIMNPKREDYDNRKEYFYIVQVLNILSNYFNIVQFRVAALAILRLKENSFIDLKIMKKVFTLLETFHFVYNSIMQDNPNKIETIYSIFAVQSESCKNKTMAQEIINTKLVEPLKKLLPKKDEFIAKFIELKYSKKDNPYNVKTKYALNKLNCYYEQDELFCDDGTIEHITAEKNGDEFLNIGNLILLEKQLNNEADTMTYNEKVNIYRKSRYKWVEDFLEKHEKWCLDNIEVRAKELAIIFFEKIVVNNIKKI